MAYITENLDRDPLNHDQIEAAMRRARVIRSQTFAALADRLWLGLKRAAKAEPARIVRGVRPFTLVFGRPAPQTKAARPVTAVELRAVFGTPANTPRGAWRRSA